MSDNNQYTLKELEKKLTGKQKKFCKEYIIDWNATRAALEAGYSKKMAHSIGYENTKKHEIQQYCEYLNKNYEKLAEISKLKTILEWKKIAFSNISDLFEIENNELQIKDKKKLSELPREITDLVSEIQQTKDGFKLKLYCKDNALTQLAKLMGWNEPEKSDITLTDKIKSINKIDFTE